MKIATYFIPNLFLNALLVYFILYLLIEGIIWLFNIQKSIWQIGLRLFPLLKLIIDPFQYHFANWALTNGISFHTQIKDSRLLNLEAFLNTHKGAGFGGFLSLKEAPFKFALLDPFFEKYGLYLASAITISILFIVAIQLTRWICVLYKEVHFTEPSTTNFDTSLLPETLIQKLVDNKVSIVISQRDHFSPYITIFKKRRIVLPNSAMQTLSQDELVAVLHHELAHLNKGLLAALAISSFLQSIFFFARLDKLRLSIEKWCDERAIKLSSSRYHLMQAIHKMATYKSYPLAVVLQFTTPSDTLKRIRSIHRLKHEHWLKQALTVFLFLLMGVVMFNSHLGHF